MGEDEEMADLLFQIAQANVARGKAPLTDPQMTGFVEQLDYINSVADRAPGFVWRLQTQEGDSTAIRVFGDPLVIFNMSVWESVEALYEYVFRSDHLGPVKDRRNWFLPMARPHSVLWWIPAGTRPTVQEGERRLDLLKEHGPHAEAFTFAKLFDAAGRPMARAARMDRECGV